MKNGCCYIVKYLYCGHFTPQIASYFSRFLAHSKWIIDVAHILSHSQNVRIVDGFLPQEGDDREMGVEMKTIASSQHAGQAEGPAPKPDAASQVGVCRLWSVKLEVRVAFCGAGVKVSVPWCLELRCPPLPNLPRGALGLDPPRGGGSCPPSCSIWCQI